MRRLGLRGICPRRWKTTTIVDHADASPAARRAGLGHRVLNAVWVGDIRYRRSWVRMAVPGLRDRGPLPPRQRVGRSGPVAHRPRRRCPPMALTQPPLPRSPQQEFREEGRHLLRSQPYLLIGDQTRIGPLCPSRSCSRSHHLLQVNANVDGLAQVAVGAAVRRRGTLHHPVCHAEAPIQGEPASGSAPPGFAPRPDLLATVARWCDRADPRSRRHRPGLRRRGLRLVRLVHLSAPWTLSRGRGPLRPAGRDLPRSGADRAGRADGRRLDLAVVLHRHHRIAPSAITALSGGVPLLIFAARAAVITAFSRRRPRAGRNPTTPSRSRGAGRRSRLKAGSELGTGLRTARTRPWRHR